MNLRFITFVLLFVLAFGAKAEKIVPSSKSGIVVDGKANEWSNPLPYKDKKTGIQFEFANDLKTIYFVIRIDNIEDQKRIMENGMQIWVNKSGKRDTITGILYPTPMDTSTMVNGVKKVQDDVYIIDQLVLKGFYLENGKQPIRNCPVRVAIAKGDNNSLIYEIGIPFNTFWKEELEKADVKKNFQVGLVIKAPMSPMERDLRGRMGNMNMGMMMGGMGGGMNMRNFSQGMRNFLPAEYQDKEYWFKTKLSYAL